MNIESWPRCPEAAQWFERQFAEFAKKNSRIAEMSSHFYETAGVRLQNLVDHWILPESESVRAELISLGLEAKTMPEGDIVYKHPAARLPGVRFKAKRETPVLALGVENIYFFSMQNDLSYDAEHGNGLSRYRCGHIALPDGELMPIERRGYAGFAPDTSSPKVSVLYEELYEEFFSRNRKCDEASVLADAQKRIEKSIGLIGRDRACDMFFEAEREYYLTRNRAARWQYDRQESIGIGWANHDHHTYRSSRAGFRSLIQLFVTLGFECREKFYAGAEAGWGAQVLEHPVSRVVIFADVDMAPEELEIDYATTDLPERDTLGTIGLWCALHTSSIAEAGLHHLECEFDFTKADALHRESVDGVMKPFTDLPMLKQAFTTAELWKVPQERITPLIEKGYLTPEQGEKFVTVGAPGSHLEILQRWEGFKGFNKTGVSNIIRETDARN